MKYTLLPYTPSLNKLQDHLCLLKPALNHLGIFFPSDPVPRPDDVSDFGTASGASKTGGFGSSVACAAIVGNNGAATVLPSFNQHNHTMRVQETNRLEIRSRI